MEEEGTSLSAFTMKWLEHLASVPAKKCIAWNCVLYKEPYIYPVQLTVILKFNQSHPMKSTIFFTANATLWILKAFNLYA